MQFQHNDVLNQFRSLICVSIGILVVGCGSINLSPTGLCRGEFRFDRIPTEPLRNDALHTIAEFAALDETVAVVEPLPTGPGPLTIAGRGRHCDEFGNSFLASDMAEFQGLSYRRVQ